MFEEEKKYDYITADVVLSDSATLGSGKVSIPDGKVVAIGVINTEDRDMRIINFSVLDNGTAVVRPSDYRFSNRTAGGTYKDSMRPVNFSGGKVYDIALTTATAATPGNNVSFQVLFMIEKPQQQ